MAFSMDGIDQAALVLTMLATLFLYIRRTSSRTNLPYPPGPKKLPLLGNLLDFPLKFSWETYARWGKEYDSDVIHLRAVGRDLIVLNSFKAATELLDRKSSIYSSRPQFTMLIELMGWDWIFSAMAYGERWRERRRLFQQYFSNRNIGVYRNQQLRMVRRALPRLLDRSDDVFDIVRNTIGGIAIFLSYGLKIQDNNDPLIELEERALQTALDAAFPGAFFVDFIPWLKHIPAWVPGAGFQRKAKEWRKLQEEVHERPYAEALKGLVSGTAESSLVSTCLEKLDGKTNVEHQQDVIKDTAAIVFNAATDTSVTAVKSFLAAMLCFPEVQKRAQEELDQTLGGRLPDYDDEPNLPYLSAVLKETMRWKPVTPLGVPHLVTEDDVYKGYHIPKGSLVIGNAWAMLYDEKDYPDPTSFRPERFLTAEGRLDPTVRDPYSMAFGFGRRICPGANVAKSLVWIWAASFLSTFNISNVSDEDGLPVESSIVYEGALSITFHPQPFKCTIKPRSKASEELIRSQKLADV